MKRILLIEEIKERERVALLLLERVLVERGHAVRRAGLDTLVSESLDFRPDAVLINTVNSVEEYLNNFVWTGRRTRIINLHWEQILNPHSFRRFAFEPEVQEGLVDGRVAWGPAFRDVLLTLNPRLDPDRVTVTGSLKHAEACRYGGVDAGAVARLYDLPVERYGGVVLFTTSFPFSAAKVSDLRQSSPFNPFIEEFVRQHTRRRQASVEALRTCARNNPDRLFIVRAHPSKRREYYELYQGRFQQQNIVFNAVGPISGLLHIADVLVTSTSTTLWDAYVQDVPSVNLTLDDDPIQKHGLVPDSSDRFGMAVEFADFPDLDFDRLNERERNAERDRLVRDWLGPYDEDPFTRLAEFVESRIEEPRAPRPVRASSLRTPTAWRRLAGGLAEPFLKQRRRKRVVSAAPAEFSYTALENLLVEQSTTPSMGAAVRNR